MNRRKEQRGGKIRCGAVAFVFHTATQKRRVSDVIVLGFQTAYRAKTKKRLADGAAGQLETSAEVNYTHACSVHSLTERRKMPLDSNPTCSLYI